MVDTFTQARAGGARPHDAIDIMAARGRPVLAAADGRVEKLFWSEEGGRTLYQRSADRRLVYYYAHLDSYVPGLSEGQALRRIGRHDPHAIMRKGGAEQQRGGAPAPRPARAAPICRWNSKT